MGVRGLTALLQRLAPDAVKTQHISHYKGKTLAIDTSCFLNRYNPHPARVQRGVYRLSLYLHLHGIQPIFVFDGPDRIIEKEQEGIRRAAVKERIKKSFQIEKIRKTRFKGLKRSAKILKGLSSEEVDGVMEDIRIREGRVDSIGGHRIQSQRNATEALMGLGDQELENFDIIERELDVLERIELDIDTVDNMDVIYDLSDHETPSSDNALSIPVIRTGTSISNIHSPSGDFSSASLVPEHDTNIIRDLVRDSLVDFIRSSGHELEGISSDEITLASTRRQRVLNELESKLIHEIKEYTGIHKTEPQKDPIIEIEQSVESNSDLQRALQEISSALPISTIANELLQAGGLMKTSEEENEHTASDSIKIATIVDTPAENGTTKDTIIVTNDVTSDAIVSPNTTSTLTEEPEPFSSGFENECVASSLEAEAFVPDQNSESAPAMLLGEETGSNEPNLSTPPTQSERTEQDLKSMIHGVLSAHQSIFATLERRTLSVSRALTLSCQQLLAAMGEPVVEAKGAEAEAVCARLTTLGIADASVSEDTDTVVFGNGKLLRRVDAADDREILEIDPIVARQQLGLSREEFRDLCILCGTDFSGTIEGIGPNRAVKLIKYYGSIESIMANSGYKPRPDFFYDRARRVFDRVPSVPSKHAVYKPKPEIQPLLLELLLKYDINPEEVKRELSKGASDEQLDIEAGPFGVSHSSSSMGIDPFKATVFTHPSL
ncbi:Flap endonuclease GEN 1 [Linnemannia zychae]|nr:Flap endonuclease GEN 1 [Linnemannia zychae]